VWWRNYDDMLSRFHRISERDGQTDRIAISISRAIKSRMLPDGYVLKYRLVRSQMGQKLTRPARDFLATAYWHGDRWTTVYMSCSVHVDWRCATQCALLVIMQIADHLVRVSECSGVTSILIQEEGHTWCVFTKAGRININFYINIIQWKLR